MIQPPLPLQEADPTAENTLKVTPRKRWCFPHANDYAMLHLEEEMDHNGGISLTGVTLKADKDGWLVVVKGVKGGQPVVCFSGGRTWCDALEVMLYEVAHNQLTWRPDQYVR